MDAGLAELDAARKIAVQYAEDVRGHFGDRLRGIRLYGSTARGDWTPESDIDVLVLLDGVTTQDSEWLVNRAVKLGLLGSGFLLQPLFMSADDFGRLKKRERRFALEVEREGVELCRTRTLEPMQWRSVNTGTKPLRRLAACLRMGFCVMRFLALTMPPSTGRALRCC